MGRKLRKNNSYQTLPRMNKTQFEHSFLPSKSYFYRDISDLSVISKNSKLMSDDRFNNNFKDINLTPDEIKTVFLTTKPEYNFISSSTIKEILANGGDISKFVPEPVYVYLNNRKQV